MIKNTFDLMDQIMEMSNQDKIAYLEALVENAKDLIGFYKNEKGDGHE
jgi:hypothetical protein